MGNTTNRLEIVEQFTFRSDGRQVTIDDAVIDTGAQQTQITQTVAHALGLRPLRSTAMRLANNQAALAHVYECVVAWSIYERQGYHSLLEVCCFPGPQEVLIGYDFLSRHELKVDMHHKGLVGTAPASAVPLTGGGYVINAPHSYVLKLNQERADAAKPGDVLRPHPAWRFTRPAMVKQ